MLWKLYQNDHNHLSWRGKIFRNAFFFSKDFIYFIIRHIGKNLNILKKIENGNKTGVFLNKKQVHKYALSNVTMVVILQNNNK